MSAAPEPRKRGRPAGYRCGPETIRLMSDRIKAGLAIPEVRKRKAAAAVAAWSDPVKRERIMAGHKAVAP